MATGDWRTVRKAIQDGVAGRAMATDTSQRARMARGELAQTGSVAAMGGAPTGGAMGGGVPTSAAERFYAIKQQGIRERQQLQSLASGAANDNAWERPGANPVGGFYAQGAVKGAQGLGEQRTNFDKIVQERAEAMFKAASESQKAQIEQQKLAFDQQKFGATYGLDQQRFAADQYYRGFQAQQAQQQQAQQMVQALLRAGFDPASVQQVMQTGNLAGLQRAQQPGAANDTIATGMKVANERMAAALALEEKADQMEKEGRDGIDDPKLLQQAQDTRNLAARIRQEAIDIQTKAAGMWTGGGATAGGQAPSAMQGGATGGGQGTIPSPSQLYQPPAMAPSQQQAPQPAPTAPTAPSAMGAASQQVMGPPVSKARRDLRTLEGALASKDAAIGYLANGQIVPSDPSTVPGAIKALQKEREALNQQLLKATLAAEKEGAAAQTSGKGTPAMGGQPAVAPKPATPPASQMPAGKATTERGVTGLMGERLQRLRSWTGLAGQDLADVRNAERILIGAGSTMEDRKLAIAAINELYGKLLDAEDTKGLGIAANPTQLQRPDYAALLAPPELKPAPALRQPSSGNGLRYDRSKVPEYDLPMVSKKGSRR